MVAVVLGAASSVLVGVAPTRAAVPDLGPSFQFGVAQSGFQSEGYNRDSNWLRYSNQGKVPQRVGRAVDFFHQYAGDIARAKSLGVGIYRTSVEWSRVEPAPGHDDPAGWAFYDRVIRAVVDAGMRPMITLNHWVHPGWEVDRGGWNRPGMAADYVAFAKRVVNRYAWAKPMWITFNEPTEYVRREVQYGGVRPVNLGRMSTGSSPRIERPTATSTPCSRVRRCRRIWPSFRCQVCRPGWKVCSRNGCWIRWTSSASTTTTRSR